MANKAKIPISTFPSFSTLRESPFPALAVPGIPAFRQGVPRGGITEISGPKSSGRMSAMLHVLAQATARGEICAVVDSQDQFHPASAAAAGVDLARIVWVRCGAQTEHTMRAADLLLHAGGFGVIVLDLCEVKPAVLNRIPLSYWYRFRGAIENTPTVLLVCTSMPQARASLNLLELQPNRPRWDGAAPFRFLQGIEIGAKLRKPIEGQGQKLLLEKTG